MKKSNFITGIIILFVGICIIAGLIVDGVVQSKNMPKDFVYNKKNKGEKLYNELMALDLENNYPDSPETLMDIYCQTLLLSYGGYIENPELYKDIINIQRQLYVGTINDLTTPDDQYTNLLTSLDKLAENKIVVKAFDKKPTTYLPTQRIVCYVPVDETTIGLGNIYWKYYLTKGEDNKWKIERWVQTDETYNNELK